ncbi:MAG: hypothetical protein P0Y55_06745 [Candidatus Cohnella colombiensis]|uniref:Uncharacterized protein n=1 Tax=Candidatus Cohnella colombiensis TaxID=3121368 RepID=A0AA95EYB4_9BACL|nr:MAG: hypothetical protein P0Y55_06745 [Cohnella sp.]
MKLRIIPVTLTVVLSSVLLFGGWFSYRYFGVEKPLDHVAASIPGVQSAQVEMLAGQINVTVQLEKEANIAEVFRQVKHDGANKIGNRSLQLSITGDSNASLEKVWSYALFDVAEAMENRKYSQIRDVMETLTNHYPDVTATTDMDDDNVYITLREGEHAKFIILPRQPAMMEVWSNA